MISDIDSIKRRLQSPHDAETSQRKLLPEKRRTVYQCESNAHRNPKKSAVMLLLYNDVDTAELSLVFIQRSDYVGIHAGQLAFPGGRYEEGDRDLLHTAQCEVEEEIGIPAERLLYLGELSPIYVEPSNYLVNAFVSYLPEKPRFQLDEREVQRAFSIALSSFAYDELIKEKHFTSTSLEGSILAPYFDVEGEEIWGATAMILAEFLELCGIELRRSKA